jgi:lipooligosaccharide transport system permease protein
LSTDSRTFSTPPAVRMWESQFLLYRTIWKSNVMGAFVQPLLYLLGMGLGVGSLVDKGTDAPQLLDGLTYFQFLAPALIATSAMMVTASEAMFPVMGGFKWIRTYHAAAATPLTPGQIAAGVGLWQATKALITGTGVALALLLFDQTRTTGLPLAVVFAGLTGAAFAAPITAWSATRQQDRSFPAINRFVITPLFLFGGAFYPIDQLPTWLQWVAKATPIWHGVQLCRDSVTHRLAVGSTVAHIVYLLAFVTVGWLLARRTFADRLGT